MVPAQRLISENVFTKHPCERGIWYVAVNGNRASNIFSLVQIRKVWEGLPYRLS